MQIRFPPLINVDGALANVSTFGQQTIVLEVTVKGRPATINLKRDEAELLFAGLREAGVGAVEEKKPAPAPAPAVSVGTVRLPGKR